MYPRPVPPNRVMHAVLTVFTGALWLPVWLVAEHRYRKALRYAH